MHNLVDDSTAYDDAAGPSFILTMPVAVVIMLLVRPLGI